MAVGYVSASRKVGWRSLPMWRSIKSSSADGTRRSSRPRRRRMSCATAYSPILERSRMAVLFANVEPIRVLFNTLKGSPRGV